MISRYILRIRIKTAVLILLLVSFTTIYVLQKYLGSNNKLIDDAFEYPVLMWWTPFIVEIEKTIACEDRFRCIVTKNRAYRNNSNLAAQLFYGSSFDYGDLPLPKVGVPWAIFHEESPKNLAFFLHETGQRLFDLAATFSRDSDFPMPLQFLRDLDMISDLTYYIPIKQKNALLRSKGIGPVLYIQSDCDTPSERDSIVSELMQYIQVDSYGACLNNRHLPERYSIEKTLEDLYDEDFLKFVSQYKFTIAIENAICHDYITEKLWRPLIAGSIPIYLGSPTVKDWLPNPNSAILIQDFKNISDLADHIAQVNADDRLYATYMQHKIGAEKVTNQLLQSTLEKGFYGIENNKDFPVTAFECFVCKAVHTKSYRSRGESVYKCKEPTSRNKSKDNWWKVHWKVGQCQAKALNYFLRILQLGNFTEDAVNTQANKYLNDGDCNVDD